MRTWVDNGGSSFFARNRYGDDTEASAERSEGAETTATEETKTPHYSRRGGRSYEESSDSDLDPHWQLTDTAPLSTEQLTTNALARAELQVGFDVAESVRADLVAEGAKPVADAIIRARREKRDRQRAARGLPPIVHADDETIEALKPSK